MSKIEWTEKTWNPSIGCNKVSAGCKNCYAEVMAKRLQAMGNKDYKDGFKFKIMPHRLDFPKTIKKPTTFFVNSMSDLFHEKMPFDFLDKIFKVMLETPRHTYQILTKRENIIYDYCKEKIISENIFLGVTVENQKSKKRIDVLRKIKSNRFLSIEPLLEDLGALDLFSIHWVIVGGESGFCARPMRKEWVLNIKRQCENQQIPFFFKQWGSYGEDGIKRNKKANGRLLSEKIWNHRPIKKQQVLEVKNIGAEK